MKFSILDSTAAALTVVAAPSTSATGNAGAFNGALSYTNSDPSIVKITPSSDGLSVDVERVGPLGSATIIATDGVVSASFTVEVQPSQATDILFSAAPAIAAAAAPAVAAA